MHRIFLSPWPSFAVFYMYRQQFRPHSLSRFIVRHLRRAVSAMEAVYPPNYPELGDFHAALADANASFLEKRGQALPKKTRSQTDRFGGFILSAGQSFRNS